MMVLFDQIIPRNLRQYMVGFEVQTSALMGWGPTANGELPRRTEDAGFDVSLTGDQNLSYQQDLSERRIGIVELTKNNWPSVEPRIAAVILGRKCGITTVIAAPGRRL